jgi:hypothetical protein
MNNDTTLQTVVRVMNLTNCDIHIPHVKSSNVQDRDIILGHLHIKIRKLEILGPGGIAWKHDPCASIMESS